MEDVLSTIFALIPSIETHKTLIVTCDKWKVMNVKAIMNTCDQLISIINIFPEASWDWEYISKNTTEEIVLKYPNKPWNIYGLASNIDIDCKNIISQIGKLHNWDYDTIINDRKLKYNLLNRILDAGYEWSELHNNISTEFILEHPRAAYNWKTILNNSKIPRDIIINNPDINWNWAQISKTMPINFILEYPNNPWDWSMISLNKNIMMNDIRNNLDLSWDWINISKNPNLTATMVLDHLDKLWDWNWLKYSDIILEVITSDRDLPMELLMLIK